MKKERFVDWWKQDKRYMTLLKAVLMALLPLLCCLVRTAAEGRSIGQVYLPSSEWNDELFYFKLFRSRELRFPPWIFRF